MKYTKSLLAAALTAVFAATLFAPVAQAAPRQCGKPAIIGASTAEHRFGARKEIVQALRLRGVPYFLSTSSGRTIRKAGQGTDRRHGSGLEAVTRAKAAGADCKVRGPYIVESAFRNGSR